MASIFLFLRLNDNQNDFFGIKFQRTFHYDSFLRSDTNTYNVAGGKTGFDMEETKLPSYWATPFTRVCLGMRIGQQVKFVPVDMKASSLHSLIAGGVFQATSLGRAKWNRWLAHMPPCRLAAIEKASMQQPVKAIRPKQELVFLEMTSEIALLVILGLGLAQEVTLMIPTLAGTTLRTDSRLITEEKTLKPWDIY